MEFQKVLEKRRSIRQYDKAEKVSEEEIRILLGAAQLAPSWKNQQTSRYYCIMSEEKLKEFRSSCLPAFNAGNAENASALIVTTFVSDWSGFDGKTHQPVNELGNGWGSYDLGLQNENLVLKAAEMGLATLIMGIRDGEKIREMLSIPERETIVSVIAVGHSSLEPDMPVRKNLDDIAKFF